MNARALVTYLLELNVLNLDEIKRELHRAGSHSRHQQVKQWLMSNALRYIVNLEGEGVDQEYQEYTTKRPRKGIHTDMPDQATLPDWAQKNVQSKTKMHFFDPSNPRQRSLWQTVDRIVDWFNTLAPTDPVVVRADRTGFEQAAQMANSWYNQVKENPWAFMKDKPPVVKDFGDGMKFVQLVTSAHFKREGYRNQRTNDYPNTSMGHCIHGETYINKAKAGQAHYFSLRDERNLPYVTLEVIGNNVWQIKGKGNQRPDERAIPYILDFIKERGWTISGDRRNVEPE